ncbi:hypothetical protein KZ126_004990 [Salmonella enterica]|nr:hypothetical protein [Salmonella enterica]EHV2061147.1 hypothetical protein [Salmonella enterica]
MKNVKTILAVAFTIILSACSSRSIFIGDYYNAGLDDNMCYYNLNNNVYTSRNGTCSFLSKTLFGMRSNKEEFIVLFSSLGSSTGYTSVYHVNKNNVNELSKIFTDFISWSSLDESERLKEANTFNNSGKSKNQIGSNSDRIEYSYINKAPETILYENYRNKPVLMIHKYQTYFGYPNDQVWLITPEGSEKFVSFLQKTSQSLK